MSDKKKKYLRFMYSTVGGLESEKPKDKSSPFQSENLVEEASVLTTKMNKYSGAKRHTVVTHDARGLKNFWEEIIEAHSKQREDEDSRITRSALNKLRREWTQRLEGQIKMLQKTSEKPKMQSSLLPIETFQPIHKTAA